MFCSLPSLCCGDSNCCLLVCNRVFFNSLPFLCCGDSNCHLLVSNQACFSSLPSLKISIETHQLLPTVLMMPLALLWWDFASSSSFHDFTLSLPSVNAFYLLKVSYLLGTFLWTLNHVPGRMKNRNRGVDMFNNLDRAETLCFSQLFVWSFCV